MWKVTILLSKRSCDSANAYAFYDTLCRRRMQPFDGRDVGSRRRTRLGSNGS